MCILWLCVVLGLLSGVAAQAGGAGYALSLHGPGKFVASDRIGPLTELSVSFWVRQGAKLQATSAFGLYTDNGVRPLIAGYWVGEFFVTLEVSKGRIQTGSSFVATDWTHLAFNWQSSDGSADIYLNGTRVATGKISAGDVVPASRFYLGRPYTDNWNTNIYGAVDQVAFFNKTLDATQIQLLMRQPPTALTHPMANLVAYWGFEDVDLSTSRVASSYGASIGGQLLLSQFNLYEGLFNPGPITRLRSTAPWRGSGFSIVKTVVGRDVVVPLVSVINDTATIDTLPATGTLYLLDASGAVTATAVNAGEQAPFGVAYRGTSLPDTFLYSVSGEQAEAIVLQNKPPAVRDITFHAYPGFRYDSRFGVEEPRPFQDIDAVMFPIDEDDYHSEITIEVLSWDAGVGATFLDGSSILSPKPFSLPTFNITAGMMFYYDPPGQVYGANYSTIFFRAYDGFAYSAVSAYRINVVQSVNPPYAGPIAVNTTENTMATVDFNSHIVAIPEYDTTPPGGGITVDAVWVQLLSVPTTGVLYQAGAGLRLAQIKAPSVTIESYWASGVVNASSWKPSNFGLWAPLQALGPPNAFPMYGDSGSAWSSQSPDEYGWITVTFPVSLYVSDIEIFQNWYPGTIYRIAAYDYAIDRFVIVFEITPPSKSTGTAATIFTPSLCPTTFATDMYRIEYAPGGPGSYPQIDAIRISGSTSPLRADIIDTHEHTLTYSPNPYRNGPDSFSYMLNRCAYWSYYRDGTLPPATVSIFVEPINYVPIANSTTFEMDAVGSPGPFSISITAVDPDADDLFTIISSRPANGELRLTDNADDVALSVGDSVAGLTLFYHAKTCSVMGEVNFIDSFQVVVTDTELQSQLVTLTVNVDCEGPIQKMIKGVVNFVVALCVICAVAIIICIGLVIAWRETRTIRSISPSFCIVALLGALSVVISPIFITSYIQSCKAWLALLTYGIIFFFSSIIVKAFRLDRIFSNKSLKVFAIPNKQLFMYLGGLCIPQTVLLIVWNLQSPFGIMHIPIPNSRQSIPVCGSNNSTIYTVIQMSYLIILFLAAAVLAWRIRNIPLGQYKESKEIFFAVYNCGFVALVATPLAMIQFWNSTATMVIICVGSCFAATVSIVILFAAKFSRIVRDKEVSAKWSYNSSKTGSKSGSVDNSNSWNGRSSTLSGGLASKVVGSSKRRTTDTMSGKEDTVLEGLASHVLNRHSSTSSDDNSSSSSSSSTTSNSPSESSAVELVEVTPTSKPKRKPKKTGKKTKMQQKPSAEAEDQGDANE